MAKVKRFLIQGVVAVLVAACLVVALRELVREPINAFFGLPDDRPALSEQQLAALQRNAVSIQNERDRVVFQALKADRAEQEFRELKARQKIKTLPQYAAAKLAFFAGLGACLVAAVAILLVGFSIAIFRHSQELIGALTFRAIPEQYRLMIAQEQTRKEEERTRREQMKIEARQAKALPIVPEVMPETMQDDLLALTGAECMIHLKDSQGIFLGLEHSTQTPIFLTLEQILNAGVNGDPGVGKSNLMALIVTQARMAGALTIIIDLHGHHEEGFSGRIHAFDGMSGVYICKNRNEVPIALAKISGILDARKKLSKTSHLPEVLCVFCEIIGLIKAFPTRSMC